VEFDPDAGMVTGEPRAVVTRASMESFFVQVHAAATPGLLACVPGGERAVGRLAWVDEAGDTEYLDAPALTDGAVDVSDDGRRLAVHVGDVTDYIWLYDLERREGRRLTAGEYGGWPVWHPDGKSVSFRAWRELVSGSRIVSHRLGAAKALYELAAPADATRYSWRPDGRVLATVRGFDSTVTFVGTDQAPALAAREFFGNMPSFSPDGTRSWPACGRSAPARTTPSGRMPSRCGTNRSSTRP